jgi:hypothetical protein
VSWEILFMRLPDGIASLNEVPKDYEMPPLGDRQRIIARIQERLPDVDLSSPDWGLVVYGESFAIEFDLGRDDVARFLKLYVRGGMLWGGEALGAIREVSEALGCKPFDCNISEFLDLDSPEAAESIEKWRALRDRVVAKR